ncbi:MAG: phage terminase large subunit, partial [Chloroflexota bacterium]
MPEALRGGTVLWTAPTYGQTKIAWDECIKMASGVATFNKTEMTASFPNHGRIIFRSMDNPANARGHTSTLVVVDEAADVKEEAWYEVLRPTLLDTRGRAWVIGTPQGRNWFWREWMIARGRDDSYAWQAPALGASIDPVSQNLVRSPHPLENPEISFDELSQIWTTTPERSFRQEILAEFLDDGGGVFRYVTNRILGELREPYPGRFGIGADFARQHDFTVLT